MCIAAAVLGAAVIGAAGSAIAGSEAASATTDATNASIAAQKQAQQSQQALNAPYAAIGTGTPGTAGQPGTTGAIQQYQNLLGLGPGGTADIEKTLAATPGYQFARDQGLEATLNKATLSNPGGVSGNTLAALDTFATGLADQTYQSAVSNAQNAVTIGQNAAAGTGAGILQTGANIGTTIANSGSTLAGIQANEVAGIANAASGALGNYTTLNTLRGLDAGSIDPGWASGANANAALTGIAPPVTPVIGP